MDTLGLANYGPLSEVKLYWHGSVGITQLVLYREVKCIVSLIQSDL